ncbi:MAG: nucleotidyltransferase family protein [Myxococcales bacterium]|nr:nucleotidyltransferase family protein [Myxococcales bacterium]
MDEATRSFLQHLEAMELLSRAGSVLNAADVRPMALKGIWLQLEAYDPPHERPVADVDLLVRDDEFARATACLADAGYRARHPDPRQVVLRRPSDPLSIDLHRALFLPGSFSLPASEMLERGRGPVRVRGVELFLPDPRDGFAHLIGHATRSRERIGDLRYAQDFARIGASTNVTAAEVAEHLDQCGMGRAARYVLAGPEHQNEAFCQSVLAALTRDPVGDALARACRWANLQLDSKRRAGAAVTYLLERSLPRGASALGREATRRLVTHARDWFARGP